MKQYRPASDQLHVVSRKNGWQVVRSEDGGRGPHHDVGPWWPTTKGAYQFCRTLETPPVSPVRVEASPPDAKPLPPPSAVLASDEAALA